MSTHRSSRAYELRSRVGLEWGVGLLLLSACVPGYASDDADGGSDAASHPDATADGGGVDAVADGSPLDAGVDSPAGETGAPPAAVGLALLGDFSPSTPTTTCAFHGGVLDCWGDNSEGLLERLITGTTSPSPGPVVGASGPFSSAISVTGQEGTLCALVPDAGAYCWGDNGLTGGSTGPAGTPVQLTGTPDAVSAGTSIVCAKQGHDAYCWGTSSWGEQTGDAGTALLPVKVTSAAVAGQVGTIAAGYDNACVIQTGGNVACWGRNDGQQSGPSTSETCAGGPCITQPTVVSGVSNVQQISVGMWHTCVIDGNHDVFCWGSGDQGQLGTTLGNTDCNSSGAFACTGAPQPIAAFAGATQVAAAGGTTCALVAGKVHCIGRNQDQQWGCNSSMSESPTPLCAVSVDASTELADVRVFGLRREYGCALTGSGEVYCWGSSTTGATGTTTAQTPYASVVTFSP